MKEKQPRIHTTRKKHCRSARMVLCSIRARMTLGTAHATGHTMIPIVRNILDANKPTLFLFSINGSCISCQALLELHKFFVLASFCDVSAEPLDKVNTARAQRPREKFLIISDQKKDPTSSGSLLVAMEKSQIKAEGTSYDTSTQIVIRSQNLTGPWCCDSPKQPSPTTWRRDRPTSSSHSLIRRLLDNRHDTLIPMQCHFRYDALTTDSTE